jgi:ferritin-like metal-binding protein YciE
MNDDAARELYITGLHNAHAMEEQALSIMKPQVDRLEEYPQMASRLQQHIAETEGQIRRLDEVMRSTGTDESAVKDTFLSAVGTAAAAGHAVTSDEVIKNALANHAFENYEIAAYISLLTAARHVGDTTGVRLLEQNLEEERDMAGWLANHLPEVTEAYIGLRAAGESGKR